jgi:hypothetical protein
MKHLFTVISMLMALLSLTVHARSQVKYCTYDRWERFGVITDETNKANNSFNKVSKTTFQDIEILSFNHSHPNDPQIFYKFVVNHVCAVIIGYCSNNPSATTQIMEYKSGEFFLD